MAKKTNELFLYELAKNAVTFGQAAALDKARKGTATLEERELARHALRQPVLLKKALPPAVPWFLSGPK